MNKFVSVVLVLSWLLILPIQFIIQYKILDMIHATFLMWILFWINIPFAILVNVLGKILADSIENKNA